MILVADIEAFLFPLLKFYRKFTFFHNAISLNPSSARAFSQETPFGLLSSRRPERFKTTLLAHSCLPKSTPANIFSFPYRVC